MRAFFSVVAVHLLNLPLVADLPRADPAGDPLPLYALMRFGTTRLKHAGIGGEDNYFAFRPDSRAIASWNDNSIRLWDLGDGKQHWQFEIPAKIKSVVFSPDGKRLAVCCGAGVVLVDAVTGRLDRTVTKALRVAAAFAPDGKALATIQREPAGLVEVWDTAAGQRIVELPVESGKLEEIGFTPTGKELVVTAKGTKNGSAIVWIVSWDVATWKRRPDFEPDVRMSSYELSSDGRWLGTRTSADSRIQFWDSLTGQAAGFIDLNIGHFNFGHDGKTIVTSEQDRSNRTTVIAIWDTATVNKLRGFKIPRTLGEQARLSPNGKLIATTKRGEMLCIWDAETGKRLLESAGHDDQVTGLSFTPDGARLVSIGSDMRVWETATGARLATFPSSLQPFALLPGRREIFFDWGGFRRMDLATGQQVGGLFAPPSLRGQLPGDVFRATAFSVNNSSVVAYGNLHGPNRKEIVPYQVMWDLATGQPTHELALPAIASIDAFSANGRVAIHTNTVSRPAAGAAAQAGFPTEYSTDAQANDVVTGRTLADIRIPETWSFHVTVAADGHSFATASGRRGAVPAHPFASLDLRIWEIRTGRERVVIPLKTPGHYDPSAMTLSPDGRLVAVSRPSGRIELFDLATGRELIAYSGFESQPYKLAFRSDGRTLASGHTNGTALLWDVPVPPRIPATGDALEAAWSELASDDPVRADRASWTLADSPATVTFLAERMKPTDANVVERIRSRIADLDSKLFQVRENASRELATLAENAEGVLREALRGQLSEEQRVRVQRLLEFPSVVRSPELLRQLRAIETLERMGTPEADAVLRRLAVAPPVSHNARSEVRPRAIAMRKG